MDSFRSKKKWSHFSQGVQELRWLLRQWLEQLLAVRVTSYEGSDSVVYGPRSYSKYKLVPYDDESMPPLAGLDEGILLCIDKEEVDRVCSESLIERQPRPIPWQLPFVYKVGRQRSYRSVSFPVAQLAIERQCLLDALSVVIRHLEPKLL